MILYTSEVGDGFFRFALHPFWDFYFKDAHQFPFRIVAQDMIDSSVGCTCFASKRGMDSGRAWFSSFEEALQWLIEGEDK